VAKTCADFERENGTLKRLERGENLSSVSIFFMHPTHTIPHTYWIRGSLLYTKNNVMLILLDLCMHPHNNVMHGRLL
jgi:hypothetical protein